MKNTLLIIAMLLVANFSFAGDDDDDDKKRPNGIRAGWTSSTLESSSEKFSSQSGFYIGFVRKIKIVPLVRVETGLEYMTAGGKKDNTQVNLGYLVLPAQAVVKIGPMFALAGLNGALKLSQSIEVDGTKIDLTDDNKAKALDFLVDAGAGFSFAFLSVEGRYYWGLSTVESGYQNRLFELGLKLSF